MNYVTRGDNTMRILMLKDNQSIVLNLKQNYHSETNQRKTKFQD